MPPHAAILAGGQGRRMGGQDKALVLLGGQPLALRLAGCLAPQAAALAISANGDAGRLAFLGLPVLQDAPPSRGPLSGLLAALDWAEGAGAADLVTAAVDTPFLPPDLVARLQAAARPGHPVLARAGDRLHPTVALWPVALRADLAAFVASGAPPRMLEFAARHDPSPADFDAAELANLNTPDDLARAEARLRGAAA